VEIDLGDVARRWGVPLVSSIILVVAVWSAYERFRAERGGGEPVPDDAALELANAHLAAATALAERVAAGCPRSEPPPGVGDLTSLPSPAARDPIAALPRVVGVHVACWWGYRRVGDEVGSVGDHYVEHGAWRRPESAPDHVGVIEGAFPGRDDTPAIVSGARVSTWSVEPGVVVLEVARPVPGGQAGAHASVSVALRRDGVSP